MPGVAIRARSLSTKVFHRARKGRGSAVTITVSSMSDTIPNLVSGPMTRMLAFTASVPSARSVAVCQPGDSSTFTTVSTSPPRSALTRVVTPSISMSTFVNCRGTLVNALQPRTFWLPFFAACSARLPGFGLLVRTTRPRTRTHDVEPYPW